MPKDAFVEAAPLLTGTLRDRRGDIKRNLIEFILSSEEINSEFDVKDIIETADSQLGCSIEDAHVVKSLAQLEDEGVVESVSERKYRVDQEPDIDTFQSLISPVWEEFKILLEEKDEDIDFQFIDTEVEGAFRRFFSEFFNSIYSSSEDMSEYDIDTLADVDFDDKIDNIADNHDLNKKDVFTKTLKEYINDPGEELKEFIQKAYTGIINYNILRREEETIEFELDGPNKEIFLDTNVLVAILCETHPSHELVQSTIKRATSEELGYEIYYIPTTASELESFIEGSRNELKDFHRSGANKDVIDSQFVEDYIRRDISFKDYIYKILNNWRERLEAEGIVEYGGDVDYDENLYEMAEQSIKKVEKIKDQHGGDIKPPHKIDHDAKLVSFVAGERESVENASLGPFVASFDKTVTAVGNIQNKQSNNKLSLHVRSLLEYLLAFSPIEIDEGNRDDVAVALLRSATNFRDSLSIEEYSKLVRPKLGFEQGQEEFLAKVLRESDRSDELEEALKHDRGSDADQITASILSDDAFLRELSEEWKLKEKMREASETVDERDKEIEQLRKKYKNEKQFRESLQKMIESGITQNVSIQNQQAASAESNSNAQSRSSAEATLENTQDFSKEVDNFIDILESRVDGDLEDANIPEPPDDTTDVSQTRQWLSQVSAAIASDAAIRGGEALLPLANQLMERASEIGGI